MTSQGSPSASGDAGRGGEPNGKEAGLGHSLKKKLKGMLDLNNTEDVDHDTTIAPAVVHETIKPVVHEEIREEIHRDIHEHHEYHRIQPVVDVEVRPPRHWVPGPDGRLMEVPEKDVAHYMALDAQRVAAQAVQGASYPDSKPSLELPQHAGVQNAGNIRHNTNTPQGTSEHMGRPVDHRPTQ